MNLPARFLCAASLALAMLAPCAALADPSVIYLVRHGEKEAAGKDPVGHSNTLTELVRLFGGAPGADIADNEYDRVYQLIACPTGAFTTVLLTSLPATGPAR
jgi:hypothetical protein